MCDQAHSLSFDHGQAVDSLSVGAPCPVLMGCMLVCVVLLWGVLSLCNITWWKCFKKGACTSNVINSFQQALWRCRAFKNLTVQRFNVAYKVSILYSVRFCTALTYLWNFWWRNALCEKLQALQRFTDVCNGSCIALYPLCRSVMIQQDAVASSL